ncbi:BCCT family transporter [Maledivibacter halophilus]|uniref:Glycine betaine transporter n=1 Tax=Maledivibacter halophilus TaxID=36842 RepID=A0A1T5I9H4_9FIRM|nr:BCCT family transporter [Maledivibacter halophilus]SKC35836.1 glycine betaine transporter [Maledivibacter halophilus]
MKKAEKTSFFKMINKSVFIPPALVVVAAVLFGLLNSKAFEKGAAIALNWTLKYFSWFYAFGATVLLAFCLWAGLSRYGNIRLGGPDAKPELSNFSWFAISLCAGIAVGIVFYGVAEPMAHYTNPPSFLGFEPRSLESGRHAIRLSMFHWTLHTYGIYVSAAIPCAYFFYNCKKPFRVSTSLYPLVGEKIFTNFGNYIDGLAIFAIVGGIATSLGFGTMQIGGGLNFLWGIEPTKFTWLAIILILTFVYTMSSYTGLQRGIKFLGEINAYLYFFLILFIIFFGPTVHILDSIVTSIGDYLSNLTFMSFNLDPMGKSTWPSDYSIFYWAWWLAFAPIVGLFLVRCAYGRTIREMVLVNLIAPSAFGLIWFGVFGSSSIYLEHFKNAGIEKIISEKGLEVSLFALLEQFPLASFTMIIGMLAVAISFITLANGMTSTIAAMTTIGFGKSKEDVEAPAPMKIFWGCSMGLLSYVLLISGGASALQTSVIVCGLPMLILQLAMGIGFIKTMKNLKSSDLTSEFIVKRDTAGM